MARTFRGGETIALAGDRILVLAANTRDTDHSAEVLADRLWLDPNTRSAHATVIVDSLPSQPELLDGYLKDLVG